MQKNESKAHYLEPRFCAQQRHDYKDWLRDTAYTRTWVQLFSMHIKTWALKHTPAITGQGKQRQEHWWTSGSVREPVSKVKWEVDEEHMWHSPPYTCAHIRVNTHTNRNKWTGNNSYHLGRVNLPLKYTPAPHCSGCFRETGRSRNGAELSR